MREARADGRREAVLGMVRRGVKLFLVDDETFRPQALHSRDEQLQASIAFIPLRAQWRGWSVGCEVPRRMLVL